MQVVRCPMTKCGRCQGSGEVEATLGGSGIPESDVMTRCPECRGAEPGEMLDLLAQIYSFHRLALTNGQQGLGAALAPKVLKMLRETGLRP